MYYSSTIIAIFMIFSNRSASGGDDAAARRVHSVSESARGEKGAVPGMSGRTFVERRGLRAAERLLVLRRPPRLPRGVGVRDARLPQVQVRPWRRAAVPDQGVSCVRQPAAPGCAHAHVRLRVQAVSRGLSHLSHQPGVRPAGAVVRRRRTLPRRRGQLHQVHASTTR
jgi:hypothetical protein